MSIDSRWTMGAMASKKASSLSPVSRSTASAREGRAPRRHLMGVALRHDERTQGPHLLMEQADGIGRGIVGAEGVGADELGEPGGLMRFRPTDRAHLVQDHGHAAPSDLPGGFRPGQAT